MMNNNIRFETILISVLYETTSSYRAVICSCKNGDENEERWFNSGAIEYDFPAAAYWANKNAIIVLQKSSCDDFVRDGDRYGWRIDHYGNEVIDLYEHC